MGDTNNAAPAGNTGVDVQAAVQAAVEAAVKPMAQTISELKGQIESLKAQPVEPPAKTDPVNIDDLVSKALDQRLAKEQNQKVRSEFAAKHLAGVPSAYHSQLPDSSDEKVLVDAAKKIQDQWEQERKSLGLAGKDVAGNEKSGQPPVQTVDYEKMSEDQKRQAAIGALGKITSETVKPAKTASSEQTGNNTNTPVSGK